MTNHGVPATAEFEPLGERCRTSVDRPVGSYPQGLALGAFRRGAKCSKIAELPWDQPCVRSKRPVQPLGQPACARSAEGTVAVIDEPGHFVSHPELPFTACHSGETYVHVACFRSAQVATHADRMQTMQTLKRSKGF
jgi:hypothetical protein